MLVKKSKITPQNGVKTVCAFGKMRVKKCVPSPDIVLFAVHLTVPLEARDLVFQLDTTLGALEAGGVPF